MGTHDKGVDCNGAIEKLYHYLDSELTDERRTEIQRHLDDCPPCGSAFGFEAELRQVISDRCRDHVPQSLLDKVRMALDAEEAKLSGKGSGPAGS